MPTRTRTKGARTPAIGFDPVSAVINTITGSNGFQSPKDSAVYPAGSSSFSAGTGSFSDNRASMTDETGSSGKVHSCLSGKTLIPSPTIPSASFVQRNASYPFGTSVTTIAGSRVPYYLDQIMSNPHVAVPNGGSVALSRVPSVSEEVLSGLNSLYELKDCKAFLDLVPTHFVWAVARRKRAESVRELNKWLDSLRETARSPLGLLQAVAGADLMWKFGIKPLLGDINSVHNTLASLNAKLEELRNKEFSVAGRHSEKGYGFATPVNSNEAASRAFYKTTVTHNRTTVKTWVYGVKKRIDPLRLPSIDVLRQKTLLEQLGLSLDATDLWEAVPYSFVIDWFLPIQTFLEQFSRATPDPSWLLTTASWSSIKTETTGYVREDITPLTASNCVLDAHAGLTRIASFTRVDYDRQKLTNPPAGFQTTYIPRPSWPNFDQSVTGIELLLQRIKRKLK